MVKKEQDDWQAEEEIVVFSTPIMQITSGPVRCPRSGKSKHFYRFSFPDWVNIVALTPMGEIVCIRQWRYGTMKMEIEIPGGMINAGEDPVIAGLRELREETGYVGQSGRVIGRVCPNPAIQNNTCYTVLIEEATQAASPHFDDMEDIECLPLAEAEVWRLVQEGGIDHGLVLNALMFYRHSK